MIEAIIATGPPKDGRQWDCQCARCGSSMSTVECQNCGGDGYTHHECGEDVCCCLYPEDNVACDICHGDGGFLVCVSSETWCQLNPLPGREKTERDTPEWFCVERETAEAHRERVE